MKTSGIILTAVLVLGFGVNAFALNLKEKKQYDEWKTYLNDPSQSYVGTVKDKCGYAIPVSMDEKFVQPFMAENTNAATYCDAPRSTISGMCGDAASKAAISKKIKSVACHMGKGDEVTLKLKGTTLDYTVGIKGSNLDSKIKEWLESHL